MDFFIIGNGDKCKNYLKSVNLDPVPIEIDNKGCNILRTESLGL